MKSADGRFRYWNLAYEDVPDGSLPEKVDRLAYRCRQHDIVNKSWVWNGDVNQPTVSPSVNCTTERDDGTPCWHGYIENGVFVDCSKPCVSLDSK